MGDKTCRDFFRGCGLALHKKDKHKFKIPIFRGVDLNHDKTAISPKIWSNGREKVGDLRTTKGAGLYLYLDSLTLASDLYGVETKLKCEVFRWEHVL
jgi:hypothetical protein